MSVEHAKTEPSIEPTELAYRGGDGLEVRLFWFEGTDDLSVVVEEPATAKRATIPVTSENAMDVFYHPLAYAQLKRPNPKMERWDKVLDDLDRLSDEGKEMILGKMRESVVYRNEYEAANLVKNRSDIEAKRAA